MFTVDRIEEGRWLVLEAESGEMLTVPAGWGPEDVAEGDVLEAEVQRSGHESKLAFTLDTEAAQERRRRLEEKRRRLRRGPEGDLSL